MSLGLVQIGGRPWPAHKSIAWHETAPGVWSGSSAGSGGSGGNDGAVQGSAITGANTGAGSGGTHGTVTVGWWD